MQRLLNDRYGPFALIDTKGRIADFRRKSEIERAARRKLTLRASTSFFCRANAAKVGSEPRVHVFCCAANDCF
jgi:hypothetical protein